MRVPPKNPSATDLTGDTFYRGALRPVELCHTNLSVLNRSAVDKRSFFGELNRLRTALAVRWTRII